MIALFIQTPFDSVNVGGTLSLARVLTRHQDYRGVVSAAPRIAVHAEGISRRGARLLLASAEQSYKGREYPMSSRVRLFLCNVWTKSRRYRVDPL
jgi:hypothetical protein